MFTHPCVLPLGRQCKPISDDSRAKPRPRGRQLDGLVLGKQGYATTLRQKREARQRSRVLLPTPVLTLTWMTRSAKAVCVPCAVPGAQSTCSSPTFVSLSHPGTRYRPGPATSTSQGACARRTLIAQRVSEPRRRGPEARCYYWETGVNSCVLIPSRQLRKTLSILPLHPEPDNAETTRTILDYYPCCSFAPSFPPE